MMMKKIINRFEENRESYWRKHNSSTSNYKKKRLLFLSAFLAITDYFLLIKG